MDVQDALPLFYWMRFGAGVAVVLGAVLFIWSVLVPRREMVNPGPVQSHKDGHMEAAE